MAYVDPPRLADRADLPTTVWRVDAPSAPVDLLEAVPPGVVIPDGVVANFTGLGALILEVVTKPGVFANFTGRGTLTAVIRPKVAVIAAFTGEGTVDLPSSLPARFTGSGALAFVAYPGRVLTADFTGDGALAATIVPAGTATAPFAGSGTATGAVAVPIVAGFTGAGTLTAVVLGGIPVAAAFTGAGTLSASTTYQYAVVANFSGAGTLGGQQHTFSVDAPFTGSGVLSAVAQKVVFADDFNRANNTSLGSNWVETGNDVGIVSNALAVQGTSATPQRRGAVWTTQTSTPYQYVEFIFGAAPNGTAPSGAILRSNLAMTEMVLLSVSSTSWALGSITGINGTFTLIKQVTGLSAIASGTHVRVEVDPNNVYRVFLNGVQSSTPVTSTTYGDTSHRYLGLFLQRVSTTNGAALDNFLAGDLPAPVQFAADDFNRANGSLGANWSTSGGGTLVISGNEISGVGTPSVPISYAFWNTLAPSDTQVVKAKIRWGGRSPEHSAASVAVRANPGGGHMGVHFNVFSNAIALVWFDAGLPGGYQFAAGTGLQSVSKYAEGSEMELRCTLGTYTGYVNGIEVIRGSFTNAEVPYTNRTVGIQIQDDSLEVGGGQPPANLDDWVALAV